MRGMPFIIADTARTMPHILRAVDRNSEVLSALKMIAEFDDDIVHDCTRAKNRLRSVLTQIHPAFERIFVGEIMARAIVLDLLIHYGGPTKLTAAGRGRVLKWARNRSREDPVDLIDRIFAALAEQTVTAPGTDAAELVIPQLTADIKALQQQCETIAGQVEGMLDEFPLAGVLISMPGIGIETASNILLAVGDCSDFASASNLAAYAGIAPVTRRSGTSIKGEFPAGSGNKHLKNGHVPHRLDRQQLPWPLLCLLPAQTRPGKGAQRSPHVPCAATRTRPSRNWRVADLLAARPRRQRVDR